MPESNRTPKVQRWIDLIAALLRYHFPVDFETLASEVPAYRRGRSPATVKRMFERDKDELRAFGVPIETVTGINGTADRYRLRPRDFYLPYLSVLDDTGHRSVPRRANGYGYQALPTLAFSAAELDCIVRAGRRVEQLEDPVLARHASTAVRKLAHDLPVRTEPADVEQLATAPLPTTAVLELLDDAIRRRKRIVFAYHAFGRDAMTLREVRPYGLIFLSGVWYLVGQEGDTSPVKQYRLQRMRDVAVHAARPQTPDFDVPPSFRLADYAVVRHPWELGEHEPITVVVRFDPTRQATRDAMALGARIGGMPDHRTFVVRRVDAFVRWLLGQGGDAVPESPPELVDQYRALIEATRGRYTASPSPSQTGVRAGEGR